MQDPTEQRIRHWTIILALAGPLVVLVARVLMNVVSGPTLVLVVFFVCGAILLLILAIWAGLAGLDLTAVVLAVYERAWRRVLSSAIVLLVILATGVNLGLAWHYGDTAGDYVHLFALYPRYMAEVSSLPEPRFKAWQWDFSGPCGSGIAYDESDAIASSTARRATALSAPWMCTASLGHSAISILPGFASGRRSARRVQSQPRVGQAKALFPSVA